MDSDDYYNQHIENRYVFGGGDLSDIIGSIVFGDIFNRRRPNFNNRVRS